MATFQDIQREWELYPYSKERFQLMKECMELELISTFIHQQRFITENRNVHHDVRSEYFMESSINLNELETLYTEKANGLWESIKKGISRLLRIIANWFNKVTGRVHSIHAKGLEVKKKLLKMEIDEEFAKKLVDMVNAAHKKYNDFQMWISDKVVSKYLNLNFTSDDARRLMPNLIHQYLNFALSDDLVNIKVAPSDNNTKPSTVTDIVQISNILANLTTVTHDDIERIREIFKKQTDQLEIDLRYKHLITSNDQLNKAIQDIDKNVTVGFYGHIQHIDPPVLNELNSLYTELNRSFSLTLKIYASIIGLKNTLVVQLDSLLSPNTSDQTSMVGKEYVEVIYYNSYQSSLVGFQIGSFIFNPNQKKNYELKSNNNPIIDGVMSHQLLNQGFGKLPTPTGPIYFIICQGYQFNDMKGVKANPRNNNEQFETYLNFALITNNPSRYHMWLQTTRDHETIKNIVNDSMDISKRNNDFGYEVISDRIPELVNGDFGALMYGADTGKPRDSFYGVFRTNRLKLTQEDANIILKYLKLNPNEYIVKESSRASDKSGIWVEVVPKTKK